ncbi:MAG: rhodanese-like domain-containing protein, partial [Bacteroidota bacterium]|nr:rhodanese-like domain-containing protein [Bacteroidota bacterium]
MKKLHILVIILIIQFYTCYCQENTNITLSKLISPLSAQALLDSGKGVFIDVSSYQDYLESHAKGATSFSISRIEEFPKTYPDTNQNYILIGKNVLEALNCLTKWGYKNIYVISRNDKFDNDYNTTEFWEKEGVPIERWNNTIVGGDTFYVSGLEISRLNKGIPIRIASFTQPTIRMLEMYRNILETHFDDRDDEKIDLFKEISGVSYGQFQKFKYKFSVIDFIVV